MKLATNTFIDGAWYGPDYGDDDLPPEVEAKIGKPTHDIAVTNNVATVRMLLVSGFTRVVEEQVVPRFAQLPVEEQAAALEDLDDFEAFVDNIAGRLAAAPPPPAAPQPLTDDDTIVVAENRHIRRGDLIAILDLLEQPAAADDPAATVETAQVLSDPDAMAAIADAEGETIEVPEGSVDELLAFVNGNPAGEPPADGWRQRAEAVLKAEFGPNQRKTLIEPLERALDADSAAEDDDEVT